ncbi:hypothetical protein CCF24_005629 [Escherichia coli]|nr:hypothetical protein [Escherichia coli]EFF0193175.1 hypothetical protein [Escherichia coli]
MFTGKKSAQIREILISESAWEEMTCLFAPSLSSDFSRLIKGGKPLVLLTIAVTILIAIQNTVGMSMAVMMNESPFIPLCQDSCHPHRKY